MLLDGKPWFDPAVTETRFVAEARDAEHLALLRRLGFAAEMVLPLVARGRTLGVITLVLADDSRHYGPGDLALAEELARRAALAIDNARLYAEAQAAEARYRGLFEGVADAILSIDAEGRFRDVNAAAIELLGYQREELLGSRLEDLIAPGAELTEVEVLWRPRDGSWRGELDLRRKDGTILTVEARTTVVELPAGPVALSVVRDVSERHRAAVDRQRLAAIVDSSDDVIIGKTLDGTVTSWNQAAERLYGYTAEEMIGQSIARIFPPERIDEFRDFMDRLRRGERISHHDAVRVVQRRQADRYLRERVAGHRRGGTHRRCGDHRPGHQRAETDGGCPARLPGDGQPRPALAVDGHPGQRPAPAAARRVSRNDGRNHPGRMPTAWRA